MFEMARSCCGEEALGVGYKREIIGFEMRFKAIVVFDDCGSDPWRMSASFSDLAYLAASFASFGLALVPLFRIAMLAFGRVNSSSAKMDGELAAVPFPSCDPESRQSLQDCGMPSG